MLVRVEKSLPLLSCLRARRRQRLPSTSGESGEGLSWRHQASERSSTSITASRAERIPPRGAQAGAEAEGATAEGVGPSAAIVGAREIYKKREGRERRAGKFYVLPLSSSKS
eukprot:scaffold38652_cov23-Tisochrysis_lutea.AAC.1